MPVFYTVIMYVWVYEQYKIYHFKNFIKKIANCIYSSIPWEKSKQPYYLFLLILSSSSFLKKLMYIVSHCMIILHYIRLFFCCQIFLECSQIFIIVSSTAVDILVPWCVFVTFCGEGCKCWIADDRMWVSSNPSLSPTFPRLCQGALHSHQFTFPPHCISDFVDLHLLQYLVLSNFGIFDHWLGIKW